MVFSVNAMIIATSSWYLSKRLVANIFPFTFQVQMVRATLQKRLFAETFFICICVFEVFVYLAYRWWLVGVAAFMATLWKEQAGSVAKRWVQLFAAHTREGGRPLGGGDFVVWHLLASLPCQFTKP